MDDVIEEHDVENINEDEVEDEEDYEDDNEAEEDCDVENVEEENPISEDDDSSVFDSDSESYLGYIIERHSLSQDEKVNGDEIEKEEYSEKNDSTDCEEDNVLEDDENIPKINEEKSCEKNVDEPEINVRLRPKLKFSISHENEDVTTVTINDNNSDTNDVETHFTLRKPKSKDSIENVSAAKSQPTLVVTSTADEDHSKDTQSKRSADFNVDDTRKSLLQVQSQSKEDSTDDDDSGVTSDISRIISEIDSDSECCQTQTTAVPTTSEISPVVKRTQKKYDRTQTHSRLFRLLSEEHMRPPSTETLSQSINLDTSQLPGRPKSLDCEALFRRQQEDSYYRVWKNGENVAANPQLTRPRFGVYCPRTRSGKNLPQITRLRQQHQPFSSSIPSPLRSSRHC